MSQAMIDYWTGFASGRLRHARARRPACLRPLTATHRARTGTGAIVGALAGNINDGAAITWPLLTQAQQGVIVLDTPITLGGWDTAACEFWVRERKTVRAHTVRRLNPLCVWGGGATAHARLVDTRATAGLDRLHVLMADAQAKA